MAFTHQVRAIGDAFKDDFCMQKREWLVQTFSYLHVLLRILRISFTQHEDKKGLQRMAQELEQKRKAEHDKILKQRFVVSSNIPMQNIEEEGSSHQSQDSSRAPARFGIAEAALKTGDFNTNEAALKTSDSSGEPAEISQSKRTKEKVERAEEQLKPTVEGL